MDQPVVIARAEVFAVSETRVAGSKGVGAAIGGFGDDVQFSLRFCFWGVPVESEKAGGEIASCFYDAITVAGPEVDQAGEGRQGEEV